MSDRELIGELLHVLGPRHRSLPHGVYPVLEALQAEGLIEGEADGATTVYNATLAGDAALRDRAQERILDRVWRDESPRGWARMRGVREPGTVTVLFTDLVESTALFDELGDKAAHELHRRHFALLRKAVGDHQGSEVKSLGDGLMVVFASAASAVACAVAMQRAVQCCGEPVGLRIGIEVGEPVREGADFFGRPVIVAKRLCDAARAVRSSPRSWCAGSWDQPMLTSSRRSARWR
ncbi:MAG TPA: adenylate/guanylate cyclase domain-containing protein [Solirubrobacteraceae bacterium]